MFIRRVYSLQEKNTLYMYLQYEQIPGHYDNVNEHSYQVLTLNINNGTTS